MNRRRASVSSSVILDIRSVAIRGLHGRTVGRLPSLATLALATGLLAAACSTNVGASPTGVVTTTTVFADMVQNVGGGHVRATSLVPKGGDVHTFEPKPADVTNGCEGQAAGDERPRSGRLADKAITSASAPGTPLIKLGAGLPGVTLLPGEDPGTQNPHLWMDVKYGELYVDRIAAALTQVDPANASAYGANAAAYKTRLAALDASVRQRIATIPEANRKLVAFHDAFPYYAREYGITIVGVAVEAPGQDPSAGYTAQLINAIKASGVKAIFSENQFPTKLVDQLAAETGRDGRGRPVRRLARRPAGHLVRGSHRLGHRPAREGAAVSVASSGTLRR